MVRLVSYTKICCSFLFSIGILLSFSASRAEAAGAMKFDYENSGIEQEKQYRLTNDTWERVLDFHSFCEKRTRE